MRDRSSFVARATYSQPGRLVFAEAQLGWLCKEHKDHSTSSLLPSTTSLVQSLFKCQMINEHV